MTSEERDDAVYVATTFMPRSKYDYLPLYDAKLKLQGKQPLPEELQKEIRNLDKRWTRAVAYMIMLRARAMRGDAAHLRTLTGAIAWLTQ